MGNTSNVGVWSGLDRGDVTSRPSVSTSHLHGLDRTKRQHYIDVSIIMILHSTFNTFLNFSFFQFPIRHTAILDVETNVMDTSFHDLVKAYLSINTNIFSLDIVCSMIQNSFFLICLSCGTIELHESDKNNQEIV